MAGERFRGSAFGLLLRANAAVPGVGPPLRSGEPDLDIVLGAIPERFTRHEPEPAFVCPPALGRAEVQVHRARENAGLHLRFEDGCEVALDADARRAWCRWPAHLDPRDAAIYLLGPVMSLVLRKRGRTVLHASAIVRDGAAAAFVGTAGAGKSTTAAILAQRGFPVLTDDVLALHAGEGGAIYGAPGPPLLRLWSDAAEALFGSADGLPLLTPNWTKRYLEVSAGGPPVPVSAVYLFAQREPAPATPRVEAITPLAALLALVGNTYHGWLSEGEDRARDLSLLSALVGTARFRRLVPVDDPGGLGRLADLIVDDLARAP